MQTNNPMAPTHRQPIDKPNRVPVKPNQSIFFLSFSCTAIMNAQTAAASNANSKIDNMAMRPITYQNPLATTSNHATNDECQLSVSLKVKPNSDNARNAPARADGKRHPKGASPNVLIDKAMKYFAKGGCSGFEEGVPAIKLRAAPTYADSSNIIGAVDMPKTSMARLTANTRACLCRGFIGGDWIKAK